jgi:hypothetical protein
VGPIVAWVWLEPVVAALRPGRLVIASAEFFIETAAFDVLVVGPDIKKSGAAVIAVLVAGG